MTPQRVQLSRKKGYRKPDGAIVVARPSRWGNPFAYRTVTALARVPALDGSPWEYEGRISADGTQHNYHHGDGHVTQHTVRYMTIDEVVETYRRALVTPTPQLHLWSNGITVADVVRDLAGRDLACWCALDRACHADILLAVARGELP